MRGLIPILGAAVVSSALTAAAITLPAQAGGRDERVGERQRQWEQCMRAAGFDLGDDTTVRVTPDGVTVDGVEVDPERFRDAERRCGLPFISPPGRGDDLPRFILPGPFGVERFRELPRGERPFSLLPPWLDGPLERGELPERIGPLPDRDFLPDWLPRPPDRSERPFDCLAPNET